MGNRFDKIVSMNEAAGAAIHLHERSRALLGTARAFNRTAKAKVARNRVKMRTLRKLRSAVRR